MYPSVSLGGGAPPSAAAGSYYPTVGQVAAPRAGAGANGPGSYGGPAGPAAAGSPTQNFPLLRVQIAEQYRTLPPVRAREHLSWLASSRHLCTALPACTAA